MRLRSTLSCTFLLGLILFPNCSKTVREQNGEQNTLVIRGSDTMVLLVQRWAEEFMKQQPHVSIYTSGGGSKIGIKALLNGTADMAATSRPWQSEEVKALVEKHGSLGISVLTARDALSVYLHPENPVTNLSLTQVKKIFSGEIKNWQEVGGHNAPIEVLSRSPNSGTYQFFVEHVLLGEPYSQSARTLPTTAAMTRYISEHPRAIGYGGMAHGADLLHCEIDGIRPTPENVRNGSYPIARYLRLYTVQPPKGQAKRFIDWVLGEEGQKLVREVGYIPLYEIH